MDEFDQIVEESLDGVGRDAWIAMWLAAAEQQGVAMRDLCVLLGVPFHPATFLVGRLVTDTRNAIEMGAIDRETFDPFQLWAIVTRRDEFDETCIRITGGSHA